MMGSFVGLNKMHIFMFFLTTRSGLFFSTNIFIDLDWLPWNNSVCMWKDDGHGCLLIPKGKAPALQTRPPWGHVPAWRYIYKEMIVEDNLDAKQNKDGSFGHTSKYIEIWEKSCMENGGLRCLLKRCWWGIEYSISLDTSQFVTQWLAINNIYHENASMYGVVQEDTTPKDDLIDPSCGIAHNKPIESYNTCRDVI